MLKTPYLSTTLRFLLLVMASLLFGLNHTAHAEGLSGLKKSLNKGKIDSDLIEKTNQQLDIFDVPPVSPPVTKPPQKIQNPIKNTQIKKPARIKDTPLKKMNSNLKRIDAPVETPIVVPYLFTISQFPVIDESKYKPEAISALKAMKEKAESYNTIEYDLSNFCNKYSANTELCNLGRLYFIQQILKTGKQYDFKAQKYLKELTGDFVYESNEVTVFINNEVNTKMIPVLDQYNQTYIEKQYAYVTKEIELKQKKIEIYKTGTFKSSDLNRIKEEITLLYRQMIDLYEGILPAYSRDINKARELRDKLTKFYKELDLKIPIKIQDSPGQPIETKTLDITKDGITCGTYLTFLYRFIENDFEHCQLFSDDNQKYEHLLNESSNGINTFEDMLNRINKPENGETIQEETKNYFIDCVQKYRNNVSKITKLYFNKEIDYSVKLAPDYIAKTNECILLKAETKYDDQTYASTPPVKIELFSNTSKISSEVILKKSVIAKGYCAVMGNGNANLWPVNDGPDMHKESVAATCAEVHGLPVPPGFYKNSYFKCQLGYSDPYGKKTFKNSVSFLKSGGAEYVTALFNKQEAKISIRNQADWFVFTGHGNPITGTIGEKVGSPGEVGYNPNAVLIRPGKDKLDVDSNTIIPGLIKEDGTSEYGEDMDVLILSACGVLNSPSNVQRWHKVLPNGLILGYSDTIENQTASYINSIFNDFLNNNVGKKFTKEEIAAQWEKINLKAYNDFNKTLTLFRAIYLAGNYAYLINNEWHFGSIVKTIGTFRNGINLVEFVLSPIE